MKKALVLIVLMIMLIGVQQLYADGQPSPALDETESLDETEFIKPELGFQLFYGEHNLENPPDISLAIARFFKFEKGTRISSPEEIFERRSATVNEFTIMLINIAYTEFKLIFDIAVCDTRSIWTDEYGGSQFQLLPYFNGIVLNPFNLNRYFILEPVEVIRFEEIFEISEIILPLSIPDKSI